MKQDMRLKTKQATYLSMMAKGMTPSSDELGRDFHPLLRKGLIEERAPQSDICDGFVLTEKGRKALKESLRSN